MQILGIISVKEEKVLKIVALLSRIPALRSLCCVDAIIDIIEMNYCYILHFPR